MADLSKKEIEELRRLIDLLQKDIKGMEFDNLIKSGNTAQFLLKSLRKEAEEFTSDISYAAEGFRKIVEEINNTNKGVKEANKAFNTLSSIADKIQYHQKDISRLSLKELNTLKEQANQEKNRLNTSSNLLKSKIDDLNTTISQQDAELNFLINKKDLTDSEVERLNEIERLQEKSYKDLTKSEAAQRNIVGILRDEDILFKGLVSSLDKINNELENEKKKLGVTGALLEGLNKIPFLNGVINTNEALDAAKLKIKEGGSRTQAFGAAFSTVGKQIKTHLTDPLIIIGFLVNGIVKGFLSLDKAQTEFQNQTGKTIDHLDTINLGLISSSDYIKQASSLTKELGMNAAAIFTSDTLQEAAELTNLIGLSADESDRLATLSKVSGKELLQVDKNIVKIVDHFNKTNRTAISAKGVLQDVAKVSNAIAVTFGNNPEKIAAAVTQAKALGLTLEAVNSSADSLLNFESSINNEISAELITGQQLNLEKARLYALNDDIAGLTKEIGTNEGVINGFTKGNRIQRQAIADAIGVSKEDLAKMVMTQKIQEGLSGQALADATGMSLEDMKRLNIQDSINKSIEKMGEALAGPLEFVAKLLNSFGIMEVLLTSIGAIITVSLVKSMADFGRMLVTAIPKLGVMLGLEEGIAVAQMSALSAATIGVGTVLAVAAALAAASAIKGAVSSAKNAGDIYSPAKGKTQVSTKEGGLFNLSPNDSLFAFPESKIKTPTPTKQSAVTSPYIDPALLNEIKAMRQDMAQNKQKPLYVEAVVGTPSIVRGLRNQPKI